MTTSNTLEHPVIDNNMQANIDTENSGEHQQITATSNAQMQNMSDDDLLQPFNSLSSQCIYAVGTLRPHFVSEGLKKEFEAAARIEKKSPNDFYAIFSFTDENGYKPYRYIAEQVSWILCIDGQDSYVLVANTDDQLEEFISTLKIDDTKDLKEDVQSVAIGQLGPIAPTQLTEDKPLNFVYCAHLYHFTLSQLNTELGDNNSNTKSIRAVMDKLENRNNMGLTDIDRALNFIAYRSSEIYAKTTDLTSDTSNNGDTNTDKDFLESIETKAEGSIPGRTIVDVILNFQKCVSGRQRSLYSSIDVTDLYPFIHTPITNYIP